MSVAGRRLALFAVLCLTPLTWPTGSRAQGCEFMSALTLSQILELANGFVPAATITGQISACGVTFILDDEGVKQIRAGRASQAVKDELIAKLGPPASPATGARWTPLTDRREMAWIPAGEFQMGSPANESGRDDDEALHPVRIATGFWMDTTEVTNEAFRRFILSQHQWSKTAAERNQVGGDYLKDWTGDDFPAGAGRRPVVYVSWHAARAYALWAGKRLPTESEWEYAARAGTARRYWWGDDMDHRKANNGRDLWPVGRTDGGIDTRNAWGLQDTLGNAAEWTSSLKRDYPYRANDGRESPDGNGDRAFRGGGYSHGDAFLRVANRTAASPSSSIYNVGFRCAR